MEQQQTFAVIQTENNQRIHAIEEFKNAPITRKAQLAATGGVIIGGGILATVFAAQIITGALALVTIGAVTIGGFFTLRFLKNADPLIQQKTRNHLLKKMYEEASERSIEQLTNQVLVNASKLKSGRQARDKMGAMVSNLRTKVQNLLPTSSNKQRMEETLAKLADAYEQVITNMDKAAHAHKDFEQKVDDYREMDRFNKEAGAVLEMFEANGGDKLSEMLTLEAFSSIDQDFSTAIISIENSSRDAKLDTA